jgi:5'-nucleotidase
MTDGTCEGRPDDDLCFVDSTGEPFQGADYDYYSGNVVRPSSGAPLVEPFHVEQVDDGQGGTLPVGFVHVTTSHTPTEQMSYWPANQLQFLPEVESINRYATQLQDQGVQAIVAVVHEGFSQARGSGYNDCREPFGPVVEFNKKITPAVDAIVTGHWHAMVNCMLPDPAGDPRPVVEGGNHGRLLTEINLVLDPATGDVLRDRTTATHHANTQDVPPDPEVLRMAQYWKDRLAERADLQVAQITGDLTRASANDKESTLANVTADAFHWAANQNGRADLAVAMPGILRRDVTHAPDPTNPADAPGRVLFSELVFGTVYDSGIGPALVRGTVTGREIDELIESQWQEADDGTVSFHYMAISGNVTYTYDSAAPVGNRVAFGEIRIDGSPLRPTADYRIATLANNFFPKNAHPGFTALFDARDQKRTLYSGPDALWRYLEARSPVEPPSLDRVSPKPAP